MVRALPEAIDDIKANRGEYNSNQYVSRVPHHL